MALTLTPISTKRRVAAPAYLTRAAKAVFEALVSSVDAEHFTQADLPLLAEYATAAVTAQKAAEMLELEGHVVGGRANPWLVVQEKAQRALVALSARLRVCPQSRFDRLKAGTASRRRGPAGLEAMRSAYEQGDA